MRGAGVHRAGPVRPAAILSFVELRSVIEDARPALLERLGLPLSQPLLLAVGGLRQVVEHHLQRVHQPQFLPRARSRPQSRSPDQWSLSSRPTRRRRQGKWSGRDRRAKRSPPGSVRRTCIGVSRARTGPSQLDARGPSRRPRRETNGRQTRRSIVSTPSRLSRAKTRVPVCHMNWLAAESRALKLGDPRWCRASLTLDAMQVVPFGVEVLRHALKAEMNPPVCAVRVPCPGFFAQAGRAMPMSDEGSWSRN